MSKQEILLGSTVNGAIVFAKPEFTTRNRDLEFTCSFFSVIPFKESSVDKVEYFESLIDDMSYEGRYKECDRLNCSPQNLAQELADEVDDIRDMIDCSLYEESIIFNNKNIYFESNSCGQYDFSHEMESFVSEINFWKLMFFWNKYHLKKISDDIKVQIQDCIDQFPSDRDLINEWICDFIQEKGVDEF